MDKKPKIKLVNKKLNREKFRHQLICSILAGGMATADQSMNQIAEDAIVLADTVLEKLRQEHQQQLTSPQLLRVAYDQLGKLANLIETTVNTIVEGKPADEDFSVVHAVSDQLEGLKMMRKALDRLADDLTAVVIKSQVKR